MPPIDDDGHPDHGPAGRIGDGPQHEAGDSGEFTRATDSVQQIGVNLTESLPGMGGVYLRARHSGWYLTVGSRVVGEGERVIQHTARADRSYQTWFFKAIPNTPFFYIIVQQNPDPRDQPYVLDVYAGGTADKTDICVAKLNESDAQKWAVERVFGEDDWFRISSALRRPPEQPQVEIRLDVLDGNRGTGAKVDIAAANDSHAQMWQPCKPR